MTVRVPNVIAPALLVSRTPVPASSRARVARRVDGRIAEIHRTSAGVCHLNAGAGRVLNVGGRAGVVDGQVPGNEIQVNAGGCAVGRVNVREHHCERRAASGPGNDDSGRATSWRCRRT